MVELGSMTEALQTEQMDETETDTSQKAGPQAYSLQETETEAQTSREMETEEDSVWDEVMSSETISFGDYQYMLQEDGSAKITAYTGAESDLVLPSDFDGHAVACIGENAFQNAMHINAVTLPDSLSALEGNPFKFCMSLSQITVSSSQPFYAVIDNVLFEMAAKKLIVYPAGSTADTYAVPEGIEEVGEYAFAMCPDLVHLALPETITKIGGYAFAGCSSLSDVTIPGSVAQIGANPFAGCKALDSIRVSPENAAFASVGGVLFNKEKLMLVAYPNAHGSGNSDGGAIDLSEDQQIADASYTVPNGIKAIGDGAFYGCSGLSSVTLPSSLEKIGDRAFADCESISELEIPKTVSAIGEGAFLGCLSLRKIELPDKVTQIKDNLFAHCISLPAIELKTGVTAIGRQAFYACELLEGIAIPGSLTEIGEEAFCDCSSITSMILPDGIEKIGEGTFSRCVSLSELIFPKNLKSIGKEAFLNCTSLTEVEIPEGIESIGEDAFAMCSPDTVFFLVRGSAAKDYFISSGLQYAYTDALDWLTEASGKSSDVETENIEEKNTETEALETETEVDALAWLRS